MRVGNFHIPRWLTPVAPADPEMWALSRTMPVIFLAAIAVALALSPFTENPVEGAMLALMLTGLCAALALNHRGFPEWAARIGLLAVFGFAAAMIFNTSQGLRSIYFLDLACLLIVAALLLRPAEYSILAVLVLLIVAAAGVKEVRFLARGGQIHRNPTDAGLIFEMECIFAVGALAGGLLARHLQTTLRRVRETSRDLAAANQALQASVEAQRTHVEALRESKERYRMLAQALKSAGEMISITDTEGRIQYVNDAFLRAYGYREDELIGKHVSLLRAPGSPASAADRIVPATKAGSWQGELWHRAKDGREFPISLATSAVHDEDGGVVALVSIGRDIAEHLRAEAALRESEKLLRASQKVAGLGSYVLDVATGVWKSSPVLDEIFGIDETYERTVEGWVSLVHPDWREEMADYFANRVLRQQVRFDKEYKVVRHNDERELWVHGQGELELDAASRPIRMLGTIFDITGRKQAEEERATLQAQLHQAQKMESIGRLAGGVAHDFNNLLTVINGYSQLGMAKLNSSDPMRATLSEIHKAGERAAALTRQLLAFSRKQVLQPRVLDLNRAVHDLRPMLGRLVGEAVEVSVALNAASGTVRADPHQLEQVIMNLAVNARDAMPGGGRLLIETADVERDERYVRSHPESRAGRYVLLAVSDNGVGMDEATRQRIFEPFFTTKEAGKGTGLGLSMVQGIVVQSGGYVDLYSEPGQGTTFKIYLPAFTDATPDDGIVAPVPVLGGDETVLVVEDQNEVREYTVQVLKDYGYRAVGAESARAALAFCEREPEPIHLLLTDVVMPNMSGRELADKLEELRPGVKVLFMSGYTDDVILRNGLLEEGVNFIEKPFSPRDLAERIRAVLGTPSPGALVLVADDEPAVRGFLCEALRRGGYETVEAENGKEALRRARAERVDLVITDLVMPELEGLETIRALRRDLPGVGIIAISGAFGGQFLKTARILGADAVLGKPVSAETLLARVAEILKSRE